MKKISQAMSDTIEKVSTVTDISKALAKNCSYSGAVEVLFAAGVASSVLSDFVEKIVPRAGENKRCGESDDKIVGKLYDLDSVGKISMVIPEIAVSYNIGASLINLSHLHVYSSGKLSEQMSFSFGGCESGVFFELGAAQCLKDLIKPYILKEAKFLGCSHGSVVAAAMALGLDIDRVLVSFKRINSVISKRF